MSTSTLPLAELDEGHQWCSRARELLGKPLFRGSSDDSQANMAERATKAFERIRRLAELSQGDAELEAQVGEFVSQHAAISAAAQVALQNKDKAAAVQVSHDLGVLKTELAVAIAALEGDRSRLKKKSASLKSKTNEYSALNVEYTALHAALHRHQTATKALPVAANADLALLTQQIDDGLALAERERKANVEKVVGDLRGLQAIAARADKLVVTIQKAHSNYIARFMVAKDLQADLLTLGHASVDLDHAIQAAAAKATDFDFAAGVEALKSVEKLHKDAIKGFDKLHPGRRKLIQAYATLRAEIASAFDALSVSALRDEPEVEPHRSALADALAAADRQVGADDHAAAITTLKAARPSVTRGEAGREAAGRRVLAEAAAAPRAAALRGKLTAFRAAHGGEAVYEALIDATTQALDRAEVSATKGEHVAAEQTLTAALTRVEAESKAMVKRQAAALADDRVKGVHDRMMTSLRALQPLTSDGAFTWFKAETQAALAVVSGSGGDAVADGIDAMNARHAVHQGARLKLSAAKRSCTELAEAVDAKLAEYVEMTSRFVVETVKVEPPAPLPARHALVVGRRERVEAGLAARRYDEMVAHLVALQDEVSALYVDGTNATVRFVDDQRHWRDAIKPQPDELERLAAAPPTAAYAQTLRAAHQTANRLAAKGRFKDAVAELASPMVDLISNLVVAKKYTRLTDARAEAEPLVTTAEARALGAITTLEAEVAKELAKQLADPVDEPSKALRARLGSTQSAWTDARDAALTPAALADAKTAAIDEFGRIEADATAQTLSPAALTEAATALKLGTQRTRYDKGRKALLDKLTDIRQHDDAQVGPLEARLRPIDDAVNDPEHASLLEELTALHELDDDALGVFEALRSRYHQTRNALTVQALEIERGVDAVLGAMATGAADKRFEPVFTGIKTELGDLVPMRTSLDLRTLAEARRELSSINARMRDLRAKLDQAAAGGFDSVLVLLDAIRVEVKRAGDLKTCRPKLHAVFAKELAQLEKAIFTLEPDAAHDTARDFQARLLKAEAEARVPAATRARFAATLSTVTASLDALAKLHPRSQYVTVLRGRVATAREGVTQEDGEDPALAELLAVETAVTEAANAKTFHTQEQGAKTAALEQAEAAATWKQDLKVFKAGPLADAKRALKTAKRDGIEPDPDQLVQLEKMLKGAASVADGGDHATAHKQLVQAREKAARIVSNPGGEKATSRKHLASDVRRYAAAVGAWNSAWSGLMAALTTAAVEQPALVVPVGEATKLFGRLTLMFNPAIYDDPVAVLVKKGGDLEVRRAAREAGLRAVKAAERQLLGTPLRDLAITKNPFPVHKAAIEKAERGLYYALESLDANLQRAV